MQCKEEDFSTTNLNVLNNKQVCCKHEQQLIKTADSQNSDSCYHNQHSMLLSENRKRNKYRMLGTDLKRKAVHLA